MRLKDRIFGRKVERLDRVIPLSPGGIIVCSRNERAQLIDGSVYVYATERVR